MAVLPAYSQEVGQECPAYGQQTGGQRPFSTAGQRFFKTKAGLAIESVVRLYQLEHRSYHLKKVP